MAAMPSESPSVNSGGASFYDWRQGGMEQVGKRGHIAQRRRDVHESADNGERRSAPPPELPSASRAYAPLPFLSP